MDVWDVPVIGDDVIYRQPAILLSRCSFIGGQNGAEIFGAMKELGPGRIDIVPVRVSNKDQALEQFPYIRLGRSGPLVAPAFVAAGPECCGRQRRIDNKALPASISEQLAQKGEVAIACRACKAPCPGTSTLAMLFISSIERVLSLVLLPKLECSERRKPSNSAKWCWRTTTMSVME